jgi:hypothetical protein
VGRLMGRRRALQCSAAREPHPGDRAEG